MHVGLLEQPIPLAFPKLAADVNLYEVSVNGNGSMEPARNGPSRKVDEWATWGVKFLIARFSLLRYCFTAAWASLHAFPRRVAHSFLSLSLSLAVRSP